MFPWMLHTGMDVVSKEVTAGKSNGRRIEFTVERKHWRVLIRYCTDCSKGLCLNVTVYVCEGRKSKVTAFQNRECDVLQFGKRELMWITM